MSVPFETMEQWYVHLEQRIQEDQTVIEYWESKFNLCKKSLNSGDLDKDERDALKQERDKAKDCLSKWKDDHRLCSYYFDRKSESGY